MFHILEHRGVGGKSLFVDGFHVAEKLRKVNPEAFEVLSTTPVPTQYLDKKGGVDLKLQLSLPMLVVSKDDSEGNPKGTLIQVRFNNDDRAPLTNLSFPQVPKFYEALRAFNEILRSKEMELYYQLTKGTVVVFDNFRVLHGRTSFTGYRRMVGCYLNHDDFRSRAATLLSKRA